MAYDPNQPEDPRTAAMFAQFARVFMAHLQSRGLLNLAPQTPAERSQQNAAEPPPAAE